MYIDQIKYDMNMNQSITQSFKLAYRLQIQSFKLAYRL